MADRMPELGQLVIWHDSVGKSHHALVTAVWSKTCINVVFVSSDESRKDGYGRQIERQTSVQHKSIQPHGFYWRFPDEEPNPYVPPQQV
jgi:hypothetical protein